MTNHGKSILNGHDHVPADVCKNHTVFAVRKPFVYRLDNDTGLLGCGEKMEWSILHIGEGVLLFVLFLCNLLIAASLKAIVSQTVLAVVSLIFSVWLTYHGVSDAKHTFSTYDWILDGLEGAEFINPPTKIYPLWVLNTGGVWGEIIGGIFLCVSSFLICSCVCIYTSGGESRQEKASRREKEARRPKLHGDSSTNPFDDDSDGEGSSVSIQTKEKDTEATPLLPLPSSTPPPPATPDGSEWENERLVGGSSH